MFDHYYRKEIEWAGRMLRLETGKLARQADGAVLVTYGETMVLCTVVAAREVAAHQSFFPLSVHVQEKSYAAGRIPGGFFKREGKPSEKAVLSSRLIDRPLRPLFPEEFKNEVQIVCTVLSYDGENDPDILGIIGSSAALAISGLPIAAPIAAINVGRIDNQWIFNPPHSQIGDSELDLIVAATDTGILMVESEAKELSETDMLEAINAGFDMLQPIIEVIKEMKKAAGKPDWKLPEPDPAAIMYRQKIKELFSTEILAAYCIPQKLKRREAIQHLRDKILDHFAPPEDQVGLLKEVMASVKGNVVRKATVKEKIRIDGRRLNEIRPISCEVGILPRAHGSALFTRGETQALAVTTLGTTHDEQVIDDLSGETRASFLLHYNFPQFSVGEVGRMGATGRREIGHGKLAWRAIHPVLGDKDEILHTIRLVAEILESNGSSSMATVCASSLALMDAGVPLKKPVSGIAMGLIQEEDGFIVLSDISGDEDHLGDMDFKVAGTADGITALQMDIKTDQISKEVMKIAIEQGRKGCLEILQKMNETLAHSRPTMSEHAPQIVSFSIKKEKIGEVIGPGGRVIKDICEKTGVRIDIQDDGQVTIFGPNAASLLAGRQRVEEILMEPEVGVVYEGRVARILEFGAIVEFLKRHSGLVHISELSPRRVEKVSDVVREGQNVFVKIKEFGEKGKISLTLKGIDQQTGRKIE